MLAPSIGGNGHIHLRLNASGGNVYKKVDKCFESEIGANFCGGESRTPVFAVYLGKIILRSMIN